MVQTSPIQMSIAKGKEALLKHDISAAFDHLFIPAFSDAVALNLFLMVINTHSRLYLLNEEQAALLKEYAEKDYGLAQYAYARYLEAHRPDNDALKQADEYFKAADKAGFADALQNQAYLLDAGHYGLVDREDYDRMTKEAAGRNSTMATRTVYRWFIFGHHSMKPEPQKAIDALKNWLNGNESDDISVVNPMYYQLLGQAYEESGDKTNAEKYYRKAINMGFIEAYSDLFVLHMDDDEADELLNEGCDAGDPTCFLYRATRFMDDYDNYDAEKQQELTQAIKQDLTTAFELGEDKASYFLGHAYYYGKNGFEQDNVDAWNWFIKGSKRDDGDAYEMLAIMISKDDNPYEVRDGLMEYCAVMALRNGDKNMLKVIVKGYRDGELTDYAAEIEKYYIPEYDNLPPEEKDEDYDEDEEEDDEDYFDADLKLIAIIKTNGKADIIEFDVEEGWDELPEFVGAHRLDAIRVQPLYDISNQLGYDDHITGWVDNMGLLKDLPMNPVGCRIYPGPIAGDMILTLESKKYDPKSFESLNDLKKVIAALGATLEHISLDDGPDDDGRFDAYV